MSCMPGILQTDGFEYILYFGGSYIFMLKNSPVII